MTLGSFQKLAPDKTRRITISRNDIAVGSRIGGNAPENIVPRTVYSTTRYFTTLTLDDADKREVSLFTSLEYDNESNEHYLYGNIGKVFATEDFVQIVSHSTSRRSDSALLASELPGRAIEIGPEMHDIAVEPGGELSCRIRLEAGHISIMGHAHTSIPLIASSKRGFSSYCN